MNIIKACTNFVYSSQKQGTTENISSKVIDGAKSVAKNVFNKAMQNPIVAAANSGISSIHYATQGEWKKSATAAFYGVGIASMYFFNQSLKSMSPEGYELSKVDQLINR